MTTGFKYTREFENEIITFSSPGISTLLVFKSSAAKMFHLVPDDTDDMGLIVDKVSDKIRAE